MVVPHQHDRREGCRKAASIHCAVLLSLGRAALDKFMERCR